MTKPALHRPRAGSGKAASPVDLVAGLLDTPHLPAVVRSLDAETLHRLVRSCGLGDCGEIVALATPEQLQEVLDLDLWRPDPRGRAERFDIGRFGAWLEVLVEVGVETAAQTMMALDSSLVAAALMEHVHLVERTWTPTRAVERLLESGPSVEIGGITIVARRSDAWDALVALFDHLGGEHPHYFHELVRACRDVSIREAMFEEDGFEVLRPAAQLLADAAFDRDLRRDVRGYVTPADAAAFLEASRRIALSGNQAPGRDVLTSSYFRDLDHDFRLKPESTGRAASQAEATGRALNEGRAVFYHALREAGVVADVHRPLLSDGAWIRSLMRGCAPRWSMPASAIRSLLRGGRRNSAISRMSSRRAARSIPAVSAPPRRSTRRQPCAIWGWRTGRGSGGWNRTSPRCFEWGGRSCTSTSAFACLAV